MRKLIKWYYGSASIRKKLVLSYLLLVTVPILVLGVYSFAESRKNLEDQTRATMKNNVNVMAGELESALQRENDNIRYLCYNIRFRQALKTSAGNPAEIARVLNEAVEPVFWYFITSDNNLKSVEVYSPYVEHQVGSFLKPDEACRAEEWFQYHQSHYETLWTYEDGELFATRPVLDALTSSQPVGVMKLSVHPASILEPVSSADYLDNGILLLDQAGGVVYQKETKGRAVDGPAERLAASGELKEADNRDYLLMSREIKAGGWSLYYYVEKRMITGQLYGILKSTLVMSGLCLAVVVVLISVLSKVLSRRILELKKSAEKVAEGDFHPLVETGYTDEIGVVAKSFQVMCDRLNEMITRVYKAELEKKVMELKALQAMINPHFLYNCLSGIKWKAIKSGNDEISDLTGLLARFYRTSLNEGKPITTVERELDNVKAYIELQLRTHENCFDVVYRIEEESLGYSMPNFLLQPIVENAIEHGIDYQETSRGRGLIIVEYKTEGDFLIFCILNNGPKLELERLEEILNTPGKGYGLFNIRERIRIYYGEGCGVSADVTEEMYTCFTVKLLKELKI